MARATQDAGRSTQGAGRRTRNEIAAALKETARLHAELPEAQRSKIAKAAALMAAALRSGRKIIWFGNGGSATQSQHMAGEFVGRFQMERRSLPSISLTENMASVTAIGNDYSFEQIFSRQIEGLAQAGDVAVGLSTSGNSPNVLAGLRQAKPMGVATIGLTGGSGGQMAGLCDFCICVPSTVTARIQEVHLTIGHILCGLVEHALHASAAPRTR
ncbi:MAG: D-sedoheptulose 7-phosphate isomerase [Candidatus Omnitrophica bacterium]|nr:D-sedoheptulose 7-phosphate isomerase [Candidatus Omnitrophota bacterium]